MFRLRRTKLSVVLITVLVLQLIFAVSLPQAEAVDTTVAMKSSQTSVTVGDTFAVDITIANVTDLYGASLDIKFDPAMVEVVPAADNKAVAAGDAFSASTAELTDSVNSYDNTSGEIHLARHLLGSTGGVTIGATNKIIGTITFKAKAQGTFSLQFDPDPYTGKTAPAAGYNVLCKLSNSLAGSFTYNAVNSSVILAKKVTPTITVGSKTCLPGSTVSIPINLANPSEVASFQFTVTYDPNVAVATAIAQGEGLSGSFVPNLDNAASGSVNVTFAGPQAISQDTTLCTLTIQIKDEQSLQTVPTYTNLILTDIENSILSDVDGYDIEASIISGRIDVVSIQYGDVNGDGKVNAGDATVVLRHVAKIQNITSQACLNAADVNGDGKVNSGDATLILRKVAKLITKFPVEP